MTRYFYCSALEGKQSALLAGPYPTNEAALEALPEAKRLALASSNPRFAFAAYGTCSFERNMGNGKFIATQATIETVDTLAKPT